MHLMPIHSKELPLKEFQPLKWGRELKTWVKTHGASLRSLHRLSTTWTILTPLISTGKILHQWINRNLMLGSQSVSLKSSLMEIIERKSKFTKARTQRWSSINSEINSTYRTTQRTDYWSRLSNNWKNIERKDDINKTKIHRDKLN